MPRNTRNFWIELDVDGRCEHVSTGPQGKDGGFNLRILVREVNGISEKVVKVCGWARHDGTLVIESEVPGHPPVRLITER